MSSSAYLRSDTSEWLKFFESAGIHPKIALQYSMLFADHRMQRAHLADLNKTILNEVGITAVGDVLAIVKHAKLIADEEAEQITYATIKQQQSTTPAKKPSQSTTAWNLTKSVAAKTIKLTRTSDPLEDDAVPTKRRKPAPDHDVVYIKKYPSGSTDRSKRILQKAASLEKAASTQSVFDRLGQTLSREELNRKNVVKFATGTKECSPEVSSTTKDFPTLECDKLIRKVSALGRLGPKNGSKSVTIKPATTFDPNPLTGTRVTVVGGQRKLLTASRSFSLPKQTSPVVHTTSRAGTIPKGRTIPTAGGGVKSRLGQRNQSINVESRLGPRDLLDVDQLDDDDDEAEDDKSDVFSRLGKRKSF